MRLFTPSSATRCLIIAPHPDDESIACGGLIQRVLAAGGAVRVLFVTDGDDNPWPQRLLERRVIIGETARAAWGARRRGEAKRAIAMLGLAEDDVTFAGLPDRSLTQRLITGDREFSRHLARELDAFSPTLIASPSVADSHADHSAIGAMVRLALRSRQDLASEPPALLEYLVHGRMKPTAADSIAVELESPQVQAKREAIGCHRSQTALSGGRFFSFAAERELYVDPAAVDASHPVRSIVREPAGWRIELGPRRWFDRGSRATLDVLASDGETMRSIQVQLRGRYAVCDASGREITQAAVAGRSLLLPDSALPRDASTLYLKRSGGIVFFDEAGWRAVNEAPAWRPVTATLPAAVAHL